MRSGRSFRCYLDLPSDPVLAAALTNLIEKQVDITIKNHELTASLHPALIVDVTSKGKKFGLVAETVYEQQNEKVGPYLTAMTGESVSVMITPAGQKPTPQEDRRGDIDKKSLEGLHAAFFKNKMFYEYLAFKTGTAPVDPASCKSIYKAMMQVQSCTQINQADYNSCLSDFNDWLSKRGKGV